MNTTIAAGSSAKFAANQINENMSDLGIRATAKNRIELYSLSGNGEITFDIESRNQKPITISTSTTAADLTALYEALNQQSGQVGVNVFLSQDKTRIVLESVDGEDISLSSYSSSSGLTLKTRFVIRTLSPLVIILPRCMLEVIQILLLWVPILEKIIRVAATIDVSAGKMNTDGTISAGTSWDFVSATLLLPEL